MKLIIKTIKISKKDLHEIEKIAGDDFGAFSKFAREAIQEKLFNQETSNQLISLIDDLKIKLMELTRERIKFMEDNQRFKETIKEIIEDNQEAQRELLKKGIYFLGQEQGLIDTENEKQNEPKPSKSEEHDWLA